MTPVTVRRTVAGPRKVGRQVPSVFWAGPVPEFMLIQPELSDAMSRLQRATSPTASPRTVSVDPMSAVWGQSAALSGALDVVVAVAAGRVAVGAAVVAIACAVDVAMAATGVLASGVAVLVSAVGVFASGVAVLTAVAEATGVVFAFTAGVVAQ